MRKLIVAGALAMAMAETTSAQDTPQCTYGRVAYANGNVRYPCLLMGDWENLPEADPSLVEIGPRIERPIVLSLVLR